MFYFLYISQDAIAPLPNAGLWLWPGQDPIGGGGNAQDWGGAIAPPCPMLATALSSYKESVIMKIKRKVLQFIPVQYMVDNMNSFFKNLEI